MNINRLKYNIKLLIKDIPARNYLTVFDDDVFIVSYPRSGNTWIRFLIGTLYSGQKVTWDNMEEIVPDIYRCSNEFLKTIKRPRMLKSHHSFDKRYKKVIYIIRDPRDVVVSYYSFFLKFERIDAKTFSFNSFFHDFINGKISDFGSWKSNIESWVQNKDKITNGFICFRYEDLLENTKENLVKIANFLHINKPEKELDAAIKWAGFDNMRRLEKKQSNTVDLFKKSKNDINFVRKGKAGNWKEVLSQKQLSLLDEKFGELMKKYNYF